MVPAAPEKRYHLGMEDKSLRSHLFMLPVDLAARSAVLSVV